MSLAAANPPDPTFTSSPTNTDPLAYGMLVETIARRIHRRLPRCVDVKDLIQEGTVGLLQAIKSFDPKRNIPLKVFARRRITGAILDMLRDLDWVPRTVRQRSRHVEVIRARIEKRNETVTRDTLAKELKIPTHDLDRFLYHAEIYNVTSIDVPSSPNSKLPLVETLEDETTPNPEEDVTKKRLLKDLVKAVDRLPPKERVAVRGFYLDERELVDIAKELELSESGASLNHRKGRDRLRHKLHKYL